MQYVNPYMANPYMQQAVIPPVMQQMLQQQQAQQVQQQSAVRVSGRDEAMNRFLMMYPASMLAPGFISDALFDIDGRHFHTLSIESDGSRNLETFSYQPDTPQQASMQKDYVTRDEFQALMDKFDKMTEVSNGIHEPVQPAAATPGQPS